MRAAAPALLVFIVVMTLEGSVRAQGSEAVDDESGNYGRRGSIHLGLGLGLGSSGHGMATL